MWIRWRSTVVLLFVIAAFGARSTLAGCRSGDELTILHFNDFHGQLEPFRDLDGQAFRGGLARLAEVVARVRAEDSGRPVLLLFAGDLLQGTLTSTLFQGVPDVLMFDRMGLDAAVMGNHEFDYGLDVFRRLAGQVGFPFLAANVRVVPEPLPTPDSILLDEEGIKVAVVGLVTPELLTATHPRNSVGVKVEDPVAVARRLVPKLRDRADLVVVLSHLGLVQDRRLADSVLGIDLIVGGHNHHVLQQPVVQSGVPILQAGERGEWLGRMDLACRNGAMHQAAYRLIPIEASLPEDSEMAREIARIVDQAEAGLGEEIGETRVDLSARRGDIRRGEAVFGDFLADLARSETGSDVAFFNAGGFRADIPRGRISLKQIYQAFPFRNELVVGRLSGKQILDVLGRSASMDLEDSPGGFLQVSGVRYEIAGRDLRSASIAGRPIDPARLYSVVVSDFLAAGGDGYAVFTAMVEPVMTGRLISDLLIQAIRKQGVIAPRLDGRIRRVGDRVGP